jgi:hypothetical protein
MRSIGACMCGRTCHSQVRVARPSMGFDRPRASMDHSLQSARQRIGHEAMIRSVVDFAHEVRIHLHDERVIFGSVAGRAPDKNRSFRIRPWGVTESTTILFDDVSVAAPVKQMGWERHRAIAAAQRAGIFTPHPKSKPLNAPAS